MRCGVLGEIGSEQRVDITKMYCSMDEISKEYSLFLMSEALLSADHSP